MILTKLQQILTELKMTDEQLAVKTFLTVRSIQNAKTKGVSLNTGLRIAKSLKLKFTDLV